MSNQPNEKFIAPLAEMEDVISESVNNGGEFRMITAGTSMMPLLRNRCDTVILVKAPKPLKKYDIPLYKRKDGHFVLHRVLGFDGDSYIMCGDNQIQKEYGIRDGDVIAVVSKIIRNGKTIDLNHSLRYKIYVFFRCRLFKLRCLYMRGCSFIKRIIKKLKNK